MKREYCAQVAGIRSGSIAEELGIKAGDFIVSIDGYSPMDLIEYRYLCAGENLRLEVKEACGDSWVAIIEKDYDEDLGLFFEAATFDGLRKCHNNCLFCFVDQMPVGLRPGLYFKDDDYRLSFLYGNFITLTNLRNTDWERITSWRLSPLYVSVHTTNPALRVKMMRNRVARDCLFHLGRLLDAGIEIHAQAVLCPGLNDGQELRRTICDLASLGSRLLSFVVVPVGITTHRRGLHFLKGYDQRAAAEVLEMVHEFQAKFLRERGSRWVYAADEFYLRAGKEIPPADAYEGFPQMENGVGLVANFRQNLDEVCRSLVCREVSFKEKIGVVTGVSATPILKDAVKRLQQKVKGLDVKVISIENRFFGSAVTVSGLLTGTDLIEQLPAYTGRTTFRKLILPQTMFKAEEELFLDGLSAGDVARAVGVAVRIAPPTAEGLVKSLIEENKHQSEIGD